MNEQRQSYALGFELQRQLYQAVLREALDHCGRFSLVQRDQLALRESARSILSQLAPYLLHERQVTEWPGTQLLRRTALLREYELSDFSVIALGRAVEGVYDWRQPDRPEDLVLWRTTGEPWFVTIAHERDAYFEITPGEREALVRAIPGLSKAFTGSHRADK